MGAWSWEPKKTGEKMTLARCKTSLLELITDQDNRVIALSGKWGTGKTYLWQQVRLETTDTQAKEAISASLFGVSTVNELKLKIAQAVLPKLNENSHVAAAVQTAVSGAKKILKGFHSGFSALDELALLATPMLLKERFIIIDDIERKHEKLSIDEILGFIDDCVLNYKCRILLVLNSDKLADKLIWEQFREKVIDQELRLDTTPSSTLPRPLLRLLGQPI
jgi:Cdc6-like AAA superfamily ATPase